MQISLARRGMVDFDASAFSTKEERDMLYAISKLDVSYNRMTLVKGMHCLSNLTALDISHNNVKSLMHLPLKLRRLDASHNELQYLDGLTPLSQLEWINVSHNAIVSLTGLPGTASLRHVDVSHNRLANVKGIELCSGLHELHMSHNLVRKVEDLVPLRYVRSIKVLSIHENPVTSNARNFTAIRLLVPNVQAIEGAGPAHVDASTLAATQASMNLSHAGGGGSAGAPLTAYGQHYHQLRSRTPPQNPNASSSRHSSPNASSIVGQGSGYLSSAPSSRPTSPQRGGVATPRGSHHQKAPTSAAGMRNATTTNNMGGGSGAAAQPRVSLTGGSQPQAQQHPSVYQSLLKGLSVNGNVHSSTAAGGRSRSADASLSSSAPYHHSKPSSSSSSSQQANQKPRPASPNGSTTGRSSTPPYQQQQQPRHHYSNVNNSQTSNANNNNSSSGNPHNNSSTYRSDQGKDLVDTSVASFATHRMQDEKIRQLEKDLAKSSQQAEEYKRESENLALQVKQLKETIERQAKVNAMLADTNRQLSIEAARLQIGSPAISGSAAASLSVPHNKTAAKPRLSVTGLPPAAQHPQDSSRLSAAAADEDQSEEDQAVDSHEAAFSSRAAALAISDEDYAALLRSSIASTSPTKPSSKRLSTTSAAGANEALSPKPSGLQVSRSSIGNAAREPQERGPTSPQRASISGGGKRLRRSDMSPKRGSMTSDVRELAPQASAVPAYMVASRPASRVGGRSIVASAPATPKGHGNMSTHSVKNVSFGGSQFYSPPQNYNDF